MAEPVPRTSLARARPMMRLVQGDVGSGKTVVAALAALRAVESGTQAAVMAPPARGPMLGMSAKWLLSPSW